MPSTITLDQYRKMHALSEHEEQVEFIKWRDRFSGRYPDLAYIIAIPNGGKRSIGVARKLKAEGVSPGYPDLLLDVARGVYHGWRCELKRQHGLGRVNKETQAPWHTRLREQGYVVDVCYGWEEVAKSVCRYLDIDSAPLLLGQ